MKTKLLFLIVWIGLFGFITTAWGTVYYVDAGASPGGSGTSWGDAFDTIQEAIDAANSWWVICTAPPDQIYVREGTYALTSQIEVDKILTIYGGFPSTGNPGPAERDPQAYPTVIDGQNTTRCMYVYSYCVIDGFTFSDGYTTLNAGAIYLDEVPTYNCSPSPNLAVTIRKCNFISNYAGVHGGAVYDLRSDAVIEDCLFEDNSADNGGAIKQWETSTVIRRCIFDGNSSTTPSFGGGAILGDYLVYGSITNCLFVNNTSTTYGGALSYHQGYPDITNCTFANNTATTNGGAIYCNTAAPYIRNSIFWGNSTTPIYSQYHATGPELYYSCYQGGWSGAGSSNISTDPDFVGGGNYHLDPGSPCIDTGSNTSAPSDDLDGSPRPVDGDNNGTATTDRGCYEYQPPVIDLVIDSIVLDPPSPRINEPVTITVTVHNLGNTASAGFYVDFYPHLTTPPSVGEYSSVYQYFSSLDPGATGSLVQSYTYTTSGTKSAYAQVDSDGGVSESDETNNVEGPQTVNVTNVDLRVTSIQYTPTIARVGQPVEIRVTVRNYGDTDAGGFWLDWYANRASAPGVGEFGDEYSYYTSLAAGASATMVKTYTYDTESSNQTYALVDSTGNVDETDEDNNTYYKRLHAVDGELIPFDLKEEDHDSSMWFGGDDRVGWTRNVGAGQSVNLPKTVIVSSVGFNFAGPFDYYENPDGYGHEVRLYLYAREGDGTGILSTAPTFPADFDGGWAMISVGNLIMMEANSDYIFTCHVMDGEDNQLYNSILARSDDPWPTSQGYFADVDGSPANITYWPNWNSHPWDFNFAMTGYYVDKYPGDLNDDRSVDLGDVSWLVLDWLENDCIMPGFCDGSDINWNKTVELPDFGVVSVNWLRTWHEYNDLNRAAIVTLYSQMSTANIDGSDGSEFNPGTYFVYRTSAGRYGKFIVENFDHADLNKLTIAWVTFNENGTVYTSGHGLVIRGTWGCDLDMGAEVSSVGTTCDFAWVQSSSSVRFLVPKNNARFKLMYRAP